MKPIRRFLTSVLTASLLVVVAFTSLSRPAQAHDYRVADIRIEHPWSPAMPPGATSGAVYFRVLRNGGTRADELLGARTPLTSHVELHTMHLDGDVMRMRAVSGVPIKPGGAVAFGRGEANGYHLMLIDLKAPLKDGQTFPLWLRFREAGEVEVKVVVQTPKSQPPAGAHRH